MNESRGSGSSIPTALLMAVAIVTAAGMLAGAAIQISNSRSTLTVTGSAKRQIRSDMVIWRGAYSAQSANLPAAYTGLADAGQKVRAYLAAQGVPDSSVTVSSINTRTFYVPGPNGMETSTISAYRLMQTVEIRSTDVDAITALARQSTDLIQQGVAFESYPPEYLVTKLADVKVEMLADATKDARARAFEMAKNAGSQIGRLRGARMGVFQITPAYSTMVSDYGINDTSSLLKDVTAVVSVTFEVR